MEDVKKFNELEYIKYKLNAQRLYPNEEFIRFFSKYIKKMDKSVKILELGHGVGSNLIPILQNSFINVNGIDISKESVKCTKERFDKLGLKCNLISGNCLNLNTSFNYKFDVIFDVFSMYSMNNNNFKMLIENIFSSLNENGLFYSFFPSKNSIAFTNHYPSKLIDDSTLDGIKRTSSPYYGNFYTFRFMYPFEYKNLLENNGFEVLEMNTITRNYNMKETFEWISIVAKKKTN